MPIKINGYALPIKDIVTIGAAAFWLAALSFQVNANNDEIEKQSETKERLVRLEEQRASMATDIAEIKTSQNTTEETLTTIQIAVAGILEAVKRDE